MKIRTQFIMSVAIFGVMLLIIATSAIITNQQVERLSQQENIATNIERGASDLSYLSNDYLLHRESQQRARWESRFASFSHDLSNLNPDGPEQQSVVTSINKNQQRLKEVFDDVVSTLEGTSQAQNASAIQSFVQVSWSRMAVQNQGIAFDALRLSQMLRDQMDQLKQRNILLIFALLGIFGAYFVTNYWIVYRRTLRSLSALQAGTRIIGSGNLAYTIAMKHNDEIGDLSRDFNQMAASLQGVTASKADLEREIIERKRAEEERERLLVDLGRRAGELDVANKELEAFSYSVSHDLRAPLRHIDGFSKILMEAYADKLDDQGKQYLKFLREGSQRMEQLVEAMLKLSRVTRAEMRRQPANLSEIAQLVAADLCNEQPERQVELTIVPDVIADGDPQLLRSVLENLLGNALKFTSKCPSCGRMARIEFGVTRQDDKPVYYVKDNGAGFDMAYADKLFSVFQRLHKADEFPGTGIGLATVQRIIHRHGGRVWAEGEVDRGATFYFTLD